MKKLLLLTLLFASTARADIPLLCMGDSITVGLHVEPSQSWCEQVGGNRNGGLNGSYAKQGLEHLPTLLHELHPKAVTVMYGANDCYVEDGATAPRVPLADYTRYMTSIVRYLQRRKIVVILLTPNAMGDMTNPLPNRNVNLKKCVDVIRHLATSLHVPLADAYQVFSERFTEGADVHSLTVDGVHPTVFGHTLIRDALRPVLRRIK